MCQEAITFFCTLTTEVRAKISYHLKAFKPTHGLNVGRCLFKAVVLFLLIRCFKYILLFVAVLCLVFGSGVLYFVSFKF